MESTRPDPDKLLARIMGDRGPGTSHPRGRLKIFFGASAGVGKTYAMLEEARARRTDGTDVLVGWVETHGRRETQALLEDLPTLPPRALQYRGREMREFDLDAALVRSPALLILDELAHTNIPGSRHEKRWQDADELLAAGIDVFTTVNVQHLESVNDIVAQFTGIVVHETVPDRVFEDADDIELIDLTPDDLLKRLREGKVYLPEAADRAIQNFFSRGNLIALRELAMRRAADRVDAQMRSYKSSAGIEEVWPLKERILVCVSPSPAAEGVVHEARRMAAGMNAEWIVATVETPGKIHESEEDRKRLDRTLRVAEQLGAEVVSLLGHSMVEEIVAYARSRNVTKIVVGKPRWSGWRYRIRGSFVETLIRTSGEIAIHVTRGADEDTAALALPPGLRPRIAWRRYLLSLPVVLMCTGIAGLLFRSVAATNLVMIYLLGVAFIAVRIGRGPSMLASVLSVVAFDFFFVPPYLTFAVSDSQYLLTFVTMLVVGILLGTLTGRLRAQAVSSRERERRTASLYWIARDFAIASPLEEVIRIAEERISEVLGDEVWILVRGPSGELVPAPGVTSRFPLRAEERGVAMWVFEHGTPAGLGMPTLPAARALYLPLIASGATIGVMGLFPADTSDVPQGGRDPDRMRFIEALSNQTALVIQRAQLARVAHETTLRAESERLRDALLSSVSHDLRTPLGTITGGASTLADPDVRLSEEARRDLAASVWEEAERLNRLVANLLSMTRLESGLVSPQKEWHPIDEVVGAALTRLRRTLGDRRVTIDIPPDLPLVMIDGVLIEQVIVNLVENAVRYTPCESPIEIRAEARSRDPEGTGLLHVIVADRGPGLVTGSEEAVFEKFSRFEERGDREGVGLGLAICRGFVDAHGGWIRATNRAGGGAEFRFALPLTKGPSSTIQPGTGTSAEKGL